MKNCLVLSGFAGSGKSTVGKAVARQLGIEFRSAGSIAREEARLRGVSIQELQVLLKSEPGFDRELDHRLVDWARSNPGWVLDHRMGFHLLPEAISVFLRVSPEEAAKRVRGAQRVEEFEGDWSMEAMINDMENRNTQMRQRLAGLYGVDFGLSHQYDFVIDTDGKSVLEVVDELVEIEQ